MTSFYSAIQFVPDPIADERINIGVVAFDDRTVVTRFLRDWRRVQHFSPRGIGPLREFVRDLAERTSDQRMIVEAMGHGEFDRSALDRALGGWMGVVQFGDPRPAVIPVRELLDYAADALLSEPKAGQVDLARRHRREAAEIAYGKVRFAARETFLAPRRPEVDRRVAVAGASFEHRFDVVVSKHGGGEPLLAVHALSFEVEGTEAVVKNTAFAVKDVREAHPHLPVAVMALTPKNKSTQVDHARTVIESFDGIFLREQDAAGWIEAQMRKAG